MELRVIKRALFSLGDCAMTPGAQEALMQAGVSPLALLARHVEGDWGELSPEDKDSNEGAVLYGNRILSCYEVGKDRTRVWVITEADRSVTTLLLPEEY